MKALLLVFVGLLAWGGFVWLTTALFRGSVCDEQMNRMEDELLEGLERDS